MSARSWCLLLTEIADVALPWERTETGLPSLPVLRSKLNSTDHSVRNQRRFRNIVGGVISPLLANIFLHYVLDEWFEKEVRPRLKGPALLIRYADDFVIGVAREDDARRIFEVLPKRMSKYGLTVHPEKTRLVRFEPPQDGDSDPAGGEPTPPRTFDFLGFTHYWGRSLQGVWVVRRKTAKSRFRRALATLWTWCRANRHQPMQEQHQKLSQKLRGHYAYYGISGNARRLSAFLRGAHRAWKHWLSQRDRTGMTWADYQRLSRRYRLPPARVVRLC